MWCVKRCRPRRRSGGRKGQRRPEGRGRVVLCWSVVGGVTTVLVWCASVSASVADGVRLRGRDGGSDGWLDEAVLSVPSFSIQQLQLRCSRLSKTPQDSISNTDKLQIQQREYGRHEQRCARIYVEQSRQRQVIRWLIVIPILGSIGEWRRRLLSTSLAFYWSLPNRPYTERGEALRLKTSGEMPDRNAARNMWGPIEWKPPVKKWVHFPSTCSIYTQFSSAFGASLRGRVGSLRLREVARHLILLAKYCWNLLLQEPSAGVMLRFLELYMYIRPGRGPSNVGPGQNNRPTLRARRPGWIYNFLRC